MQFYRYNYLILSTIFVSHIWGGAPKSTLYLLDKFPSKAIHLIKNPGLMKVLQPLSSRRFVGDLSIFTYAFTGTALRRSERLFLLRLGVSGPLEAQLIHTFSNKFRCLSQELYLANYHSSVEHAIYGMSCLLLAFLNPATCHLSNLR